MEEWSSQRKQKPQGWSTHRKPEPRGNEHSETVGTAADGVLRDSRNLREGALGDSRIHINKGPGNCQEPQRNLELPEP